MRNDINVLDSLRDYHAKYRSLPSFSSLAKQCGLAVSTLAGIASRLKEQGFLAASETGRLRPGRRFFERQLANRVQAGLPVPATEVLPEGILIDEYLVDSPTRTLLLAVHGDSMRDAGLLTGDIVVVKRGVVARVGDIVVAIVDGNYTVKRLAFDKNGTPFLQAANPDFPDIRPTEELEVFGVVCGSFRRYARPRSATDSPQRHPEIVAIAD